MHAGGYVVDVYPFYLTYGVAGFVEVCGNLEATGSCDLWACVVRNNYSRFKYQRELGSNFLPALYQSPYCIAQQLN